MSKIEHYIISSLMVKQEMYNVEMEERDLILSAIKKPTPVKRRRKVMKDIEPSIDVGSDAITQIAKKKARIENSHRLRRRKKVSEWSNTDFLKHMNEMLKNYGLRMCEAPKDKDTVNRIYDIMVNKVHDRMSNEVLKEYFEWWVSSHAPFIHDNELYVSILAAEYLIDKFLTRYQVNEDVTSLNNTNGSSKIDQYVDLDVDTLLSMGGLSMALCSKGIVLTYMSLREKEENVFVKISNVLRGLSENAVRQSIENTLKFAPYKSQLVDFVSIAKAAIDFHNLKDYRNISYRDYFVQ